MGMLPSKVETLLPDSAASYCRNAWLFHTDLRPIRTPTEVFDCENPDTRCVYRIPNPNDLTDFYQSTWLEFDEPLVNIIRAPMVNDRWDRYYFFSPDTAPTYNTYQRIVAKEPAYLLGVTVPEKPLIIVPPEGADVQRAYVYTWQTEFGEEGPPGPPVSAKGKDTEAWQITIPQPSPEEIADRALAKINIYRTIADGTGAAAAYYRVASLDVGTTEYSDEKKDIELTGATQLQSTNWMMPPSDLKGAISMPNGMIVGWTETNDIYFCEPYRPHAWPPAYVISVENEIVGMGSLAQSFVVCTKGAPYVATGVHPSAVTIALTALKEPCLSRQSIVSTEGGVYYVSQNGLVLINFGYGSGENVSAQLFSRHQWATLLPTGFMGARVQTAYIAFVKRGELVIGDVTDGAILPATDGKPPDDGLIYDGTLWDSRVLDGERSQFVPYADQGDNGFIFGGPQPPNTSFSNVCFDGLVESVYQDDFTGELFLLSKGKVWWWDKPEEPVYTPYIWKSKLFQFPMKASFMASRVFFVKPIGPSLPSPTPATRNTDQNQSFDPTKQLLILRVYAGGKQVLVREIVESGELIVFPSGVKTDTWQFQLEGVVNVTSMEVATSVKELAAT